MQRVLVAALAVSFSTACGLGSDADEDDGSGGGGMPWDSNDGGGEDEDDEWEPCEETWIDWIGPDNPSVGDEWTVWLQCDGAVLTGPTVIRFDPLDFATVDENRITFARQGEGWMFLQTGTESAELDLFVE